MKDRSVLPRPPKKEIDDKSDGKVIIAIFSQLINNFDTKRWAWMYFYIFVKLFNFTSSITNYLKKKFAKPNLF